MKKKNKVTMLEFLDDCNSWQWYGVYKKLSPKEALKSYAEEMGLNEEGEKIEITYEKQEGRYYLQNIDARAYTIELIN